MADLLDRIRTELHARLAELEPLVDEHRRLDLALRALGDSDGAPSPAAAQRRPAAKPKPKPRGRAKPASTGPRKRAPRGANRAALLAAVRDRPGATGAELAAVSGLERNTLNTLLARLVKDGTLAPRELPTGRRGYALSDPSTTFPADPPAAR